MRGRSGSGLLGGGVIFAGCLALAGCDLDAVSANENPAAAVAPSMRQLSTPWTSVLWSGQTMSVFTTAAVTSETARVGDHFVAELGSRTADGFQPEVLAGAQALGQVLAVGGGDPRLIVTLIELRLADGRLFELRTEPLVWIGTRTDVSSSAGHGRPVAIPARTALCFTLAQDLSISTSGVN